MRTVCRINGNPRANCGYTVITHFDRWSMSDMAIYRELTNPSGARTAPPLR
jgi:hypothetical protein